MEVRILPSSNQHYVGNMQQSSGSLTWDSAGIDWTLMVCGVYGEPIGIDDAIVRQLQIRGASLVNGPDGPVKLSDGRSIVLLRFNPMMGGINAYSYSNSHAHYAIFGCVYESESDMLTVYEPDSFAVTQCDVPGTVKVCIKKQWERQRHWLPFCSKDVFLGYSVSIEYDGKLSDGEDWGLQYEFSPIGSSGKSFCYPIVSKMVGAKLLVRASPGQEPPKIKSSKKGYVVEVTADL